MPHMFEAIYEDGVFRPALPVPGFAQGQRVWFTLVADDMAAIQAGLDDMEAGRVVPFEEVDARIRAKIMI